MSPPFPNLECRQIASAIAGAVRTTAATYSMDDARELVGFQAGLLFAHLQSIVIAGGLCAETKNYLEGVCLDIVNGGGPFVQHFLDGVRPN
jgi:hypothetical protein